jgi:hypothetical protein
MKDRKGASPVPGPTMMMGVAGSAGSLQYHGQYHGQQY